MAEKKHDSFMSMLAGYEKNTEESFKKILMETMDFVENRLKKDGFKTSYTSIEILISLVSNIFCNISFRLIDVEDITLRVNTFREFCKQLTKSNEKLFFALEAYYSKKEDNSN